MNKLIWLMLQVVMIGLVVVLSVRTIKAAGPLPITGTFVMLDFPMNTMEEANAYFDDLVDNGYDTVIMLAMGSVENIDSSGKVSSWDFFSGDTMKNFLTSAKARNIDVYLGLSAFNQQTLSWGNASHREKILNFSKEMVAKVKQISLSNGWGWEGNFIKGWYIYYEMPAHSLQLPGSEIIRDYAVSIKSVEPNKLTMISPYLWEDMGAEQIETSLDYSLKNYPIDIYAPQDSVGTGKVISFEKSKANFDTMQKIINRVKPSVQLWANVETFFCVANYCPPYPTLLPPSSFNRIRWQIAAVEEKVTKKITWIHQETMAINPMQNVNSRYLGTLEKRRALRNDYQSKPLIYAAFMWNGDFILKGYTFGNIGDDVNIYMHYRKASGDLVNKKLTLKVRVGDNGKRNSSIVISGLTDFDTSKPYEIGVQNKNNGVGYYKYPDYQFVVDPIFNEITPFGPVPTAISCNRCSTLNGCQRTVFAGADASCTVPAVGAQITRTVDCGCGAVTGGDNSMCGGCAAPTQIPPTQIPPTIKPSVPGDYDGNGVVEKNDFETWKAEFLLGKSTKDKFEIWKQAFLSRT